MLNSPKEEKQDSYIANKRCACAVCGNKNLEEAIDLPKLPLTDTYCYKEMNDPYGGIDQSLLYCSECSHAQLFRIVNPNILYNKNYHFRTSKSITARSGTESFINYLTSLFPQKQYSTILDIGCNDLYLLQQLKPIAKKCIGVDPVWIGKEHEVKDESINVYGNWFEELDKNTLSNIFPDLIVCRHTLEHISDPKKVLQLLLDTVQNGTVFLFEVPAFDPLVARYRFDQVFHQHLQYFSLASFLRLIEEVGGEYIAHSWNYHDWGGLRIAFKKNGKCKFTYDSERIDIDTIKKNYRMFRQQFRITNDILHSLEGEPIYGYGAAQMLPVIAYHLENDLSCLISILDDDPSKDGISYWNLPVTVQSSRKVRDIEKATVVITAIDNANPIMRRLFEIRPKHIIYPFHIY